MREASRIKLKNILVNEKSKINILKKNCKKLHKFEIFVAL